MQVEDNFRAYDLLSDRVKFHKGYFRDSLPRAPIERLSIIRADGDMYESTLDILFNLYGKLSVGGYVIIDDWNIPVAQKAVHDFATWHGFSDELEDRVRCFTCFVQEHFCKRPSHLDQLQYRAHFKPQLLSLFWIGHNRITLTLVKKVDEAAVAKRLLKIKKLCLQ
jgi:hypothetical protein